MMRKAMWLAALLPGQAWAAGLDGGALSLAWGLPLVGMLLSIAVLPLAAPGLWHSHHGKVALFWAAALLLPLTWQFGAGAIGAAALHVALHEYIPFITLLLALYTTGGGVLLTGRLPGTPLGNTGLLAVGSLLASLMGTTGAAMLLIRPLLRANAHRARKTHVFVFFILLVGNIGGSLTPVGDPPLYLGFLAGVGFFWPLMFLWQPFLVCVGVLLGVFYLFDSWAYRREGRPVRVEPSARLGLLGKVNLPLILLVVLAVLMQGYWKPGVVSLGGESVAIERLVAMGVFLAVTAASLWLTTANVREANGFSWFAMAEVAKLFAAIFLCMAPVLAMLGAGVTGPAGGLLALTSDAAGQPIPWVYFWATGGLSAFLDNAPTYMVFFAMAGGDAGWLMGEGARVLMAISCGAVFFGAMTYIGNAPNFMVKLIVEEGGVRMPSFFGYFGWALMLLAPLFLLVTFIFFL